MYLLIIMKFIHGVCEAIFFTDYIVVCLISYYFLVEGIPDYEDTLQVNDGELHMHFY